MNEREMTIPSGHCERARAWASLHVDGELSELEQALLHAHVGRCGDCRSFVEQLDGIEAVIRAAPLEPLPRPVQVRRFRSSRSLRMLQAAAAVAAVATAGLGAMVVNVFRADGVVTATRPALTRVSAVSDEEPASFRQLRRSSLIAAETLPRRHPLVP
jgi:predicted anti-sigma-YlaC factor YlaD